MSENFMKIRKGLNLNPVDTLPTTGNYGDIIFDNNDKKFKKWDGSQWIPLAEADANYEMASCRTDGTGTEVNCSVSVVNGNTRINTTFQINDNVEVFVDGKRFSKFVDTTITPDSYWVQVDDYNLDLDGDYSSQSLPVQVIKYGVVIADNQQQVDDLKDLNKYVVENFVVPKYVTVPHTQIVNRRQMLDYNENLTSIYGVERIPFQRIIILQDEYGPNNEQVLKLNEDLTERIRFVGAWSVFGVNDADGTGVTTSVIDDFIEISFYGTGANLLCLTTNVAGDLRVRVDGGSEGANVYGTYSTILAGRNYNTNQVIPLASGLSLGYHTIRIRNNSTNAIKIYGCEILNERTDVRVAAGEAFNNSKKITTNTPSTHSLNTVFNQIEREGSVVGTLGNRGARVVIYQDNDGSIKKRAYATNSSQANLGAADHQYEDNIRTYYWREFGASRGDDFSTLVNSASNRLFFLEGGTIGLIGQGVYQNTSFTDIDAVSLNTTNDFVSFHFVGTGLDIFAAKQGTGGVFTYSVWINNTNVGNISISAENKFVRIPIVSGLPFGSHIVRIRRESGTDRAIAIRDFVVYAPKKPTLPVNVVEIGEYFITADYVANTVAGIETMPVGTIRHSLPTSESVMTGSFSIPINVSGLVGGFSMATSTNGNTITRYFYGTGFELRFHSGSYTFTIEIDGSTNLSSYTTSVYGTGTTIVPSTGTVSNTTVSQGHGVSISNIPLGWHRVVITRVSGSNTTEICTFDAITPVFSYLTNNKKLYQRRQDYLSGLSITKYNKFSVEENKFFLYKELNRDFTFGGGIYLPVTGLTVTVNCDKETGSLYCIICSINTGGNNNTNYINIAINGQRLSENHLAAFGIGASYQGTFTCFIPVFLPKGNHCIIPYILKNTGSGTCYSTSNISVIEIG